MHGRTRESRRKEQLEPDTVRSQNQQKLVSLARLSKSYVASPNQEAEDALLRVNPEYSPAYPKRRARCLLDKEKCWKGELDLTLFQISQRNAKSYCAWYHRRWCLEFLVPEQELKQVLVSELELCNELLKRDERNFHCWSHRTYVVGKLGSVSLEMDFATSKSLIERNFSNCAAWHLRAQCLIRAEKEQVSIQDELDLVHNAFFTEPDDQSVWVYFKFLLVNFLPQDTDILLQEAELVESLLKEESDAKWPMLASVQLAVLLPFSSESAQLCLRRLERLQIKDTFHKQFYVDVSNAIRRDDVEEAKRLLLGKPKR